MESPEQDRIRVAVEHWLRHCPMRPIYMGSAPGSRVQKMRDAFKARGLTPPLTRLPIEDQLAILRDLNIPLDPEPSMRTIHKFHLDWQGTGLQTVIMPKGAIIRHVGVQGSLVMLWAEVDTAAPKEEAKFRVYGTGEQLDGPVQGNGGETYCGTVMVGPFVWHIYRRHP